MWKIQKAPSTATKAEWPSLFLIYLFLSPDIFMPSTSDSSVSWVHVSSWMYFLAHDRYCFVCLQLFLVQFDPVQLDPTCYHCTPQGLFRVTDYVAKPSCMCHNALGRNRSSGFVCTFHVHHLFIRKGSKFFFLLFEILASSQFPPELKAQRKHICVMGNMKTCSKKKCIQRLNVNKS